MYIGSYIVPESPILIPSVAQRQTTDLSVTQLGLRSLTSHLAGCQADVAVLLCTNTEALHDSPPVTIMGGPVIEGNLVSWGAPETVIRATPERRMALKLAHEIRSILGEAACALTHEANPPHATLLALSLCAEAQVKEVLVLTINPHSKDTSAAIARILADHVQTDPRRVVIGVCASVADAHQASPDEYSSEEHMVSAALEGFYAQHKSITEEDAYIREHIPIQGDSFAILSLLGFHRACVGHIPTTTHLLSTQHPLGEGFLVALYTPLRAL